MGTDVLFLSYKHVYRCLPV